MRRVVTALWVLLLISADKPAAPQAGKPDPRAAVRPIAEPYEVLAPDAAWCGPRILYFFACYLGRNCTLDEAVARCQTDANGYTTLQNLTRAARELGLEPTPVACDAEQLLALGGPAIICVGRPAAPASAERPAPEAAPRTEIHFVGLIGPKDDAFLVVDPAVRTEALIVTRGKIRQSFTGHAVLLRGCPRPFLWPHWQSPEGAVAALAVCDLGLVGWVIWRRRRKPSTPGAAPA
jgi:hypothetical protein